MRHNCGWFCCVLVQAALLCGDALQAGEDKADDLSLMQGKWKAVETIDNGTQVGRQTETIFTVAENKLQIAEGAEPVLEFTLILDPSKKPRQIDATLRGKKMLGIYELQGDTMRMCFNQPGKERPSAFASKEGDDLRLVTLQRLKKGK